MTNDTGTPSQVAVRTEDLSPVPAESLAGLLGVDVPTQTLPPLWHWVYLLERRPESDLGPDGHATSGIPAPPGEGRRRMFAGGRVLMHRPLTLGETATRRTRLVRSVEKQGRSGHMTFVTARHEIEQGGQVAITEEQDIVYREAGTEPLVLPAGPGTLPERAHRLTLDADERLLFRFSALTYNAHRIHYDLNWCRHEGYDGLVVHGPLQALLMGELLRRNEVDHIGREFAYRLVSPMVGTQRVNVVSSEQDPLTAAEAMTSDGRVTATSTLCEPTMEPTSRRATGGNRGVT